MANVSSRGTTCYLVPPGTLTPHLTSPPPRDAIYIWGTAILGHTHTHTHTHSSLFPARHPHFYTHTHTHTSTLWSLPCQAPTLKHTHTHTHSLVSSLPGTHTYQTSPEEKEQEQPCRICAFPINLRSPLSLRGDSFCGILPEKEGKVFRKRGYSYI